MANKLTLSHIQKIHRLQKLGEFTDFTLTCQGKNFEVHMVIVCSQSKVLHAACINSFKETHVMEEDLLLVEKLVDYFYTMGYDENWSGQPEQHISRLQVHARMFALADKYDIEGLRQLSLGKFRKANSALELLESVPDVYTLTPPSLRALRDAAALCFKLDLKNHIQNQSVREVYERIATEHPDFVKDVLDVYIGWDTSKRVS